MDLGIYNGVAALRAQERRLEAITHNLANASTPAFKRTSSFTEGFAVEHDGEVDAQPRTEHVRDFTQGPLNRTGVPTHLAIKGDGFFAIDTDQGEAFTRDGSFRIDQNGVLTTANGDPLMWDGPRGVIDPVGEPFIIEPTGGVRQGETVLGKIRIVAFEDHQQLKLDPRGTYEAPIGLTRVPADVQVLQGHLEGSNTSPVDELIAMIQVQRSYESITRLMGAIDQSYQQLTNNR